MNNINVNYTNIFRYFDKTDSIKYLPNASISFKDDRENLLRRIQTKVFLLKNVLTKNSHSNYNIDTKNVIENCLKSLENVDGSLKKIFKKDKHAEKTDVENGSLIDNFSAVNIKEKNSKKKKSLREIKNQLKTLRDLHENNDSSDDDPISVNDVSDETLINIIKIVVKVFKMNAKSFVNLIENLHCAFKQVPEYEFIKDDRQIKKINNLLEKPLDEITDSELAYIDSKLFSLLVYMKKPSLLYIMLAFTILYLDSHDVLSVNINIFFNMISTNIKEFFKQEHDVFTLLYFANVLNINNNFARDKNVFELYKKIMTRIHYYNKTEFHKIKPLISVREQNDRDLKPLDFMQYSNDDNKKKTFLIARKEMLIHMVDSDLQNNIYTILSIPYVWCGNVNFKTLYVNSMVMLCLNVLQTKQIKEPLLKKKFLLEKFENVIDLFLKENIFDDNFMRKLLDFLNKNSDFFNVTANVAAQLMKKT